MITSKSLVPEFLARLGVAALLPVAGLGDAGALGHVRGGHGGDHGHVGLAGTAAVSHPLLSGQTAGPRHAALRLAFDICLILTRVGRDMESVRRTEL